MKPIVYVLADYGQLHDLAFAEVTQIMLAELAGYDPVIKAYAVPAFDTVATGFALAQTAINSRLGARHFFYVNTAPRKDDPAPRISGEGEGLVYARLRNDVQIVAVDSGHSLSFIKDAAEEIRHIHVERAGSQFRSRDVFPPALARLVAGDRSQLGDDIKARIPDPPEKAVCYTDGYGNLKIALNANTIEPLKGQDLVLDINGHKRIARVADGIFAVADGQLCLAPGSSGWTLSDGTFRRFAEIVLRGGNASREFGQPPGGISVDWAGA